MRLLIDGYNLMYAVGYGHEAGLSWERRRIRFLDWLADQPASRNPAHRFEIIFDAQKGPSNTAAQTTHRGLWVVFALQQTADDYLEETLIRDYGTPGLVLVSNDLRLMQSARTYGATPWNHQEFLDWLAREAVPVRSHRRDLPTDKPIDPPDAAETETWLAIFQQPKSPRRP